MAGKTSLFKALASGHLPQHGSPDEPATAVVKVPDERLDRLATLVEARKTTYLEHRVLDFPSLAVGKKGPPPRLLGVLSTCDLLVHVVRAFTDVSVPHPSESVDPARDIEALALEIAFADLAIIERRLDRLAAEMRSLAAGARGAYEREAALLNRLKAGLEASQAIRAQPLTPEESALLGGYNLLTGKPLLIVLNVDEADAAGAASLETAVRERFGGAGVAVVSVAARAEAELGVLDAEEAREFRAELGLPAEPAAARVLREAVALLGLITFYTAGEQDTHAWSIRAGTTALKAAGRIHSDIERGFIRAEVIGWQELLDCGSHAEARRRGRLRVEGKSYVVADGDVIHVLFNV